MSIITKASVCNQCLGGNNWRSPHRILRATASTLRGLLFTFYNWRITSATGGFATRKAMWFMRKETPDRFTCDVKQFLYSRYPHRWMGRNGSVLWPPRSPDLTPADLYLWGHLKGIAYSERVKTRYELWRLIPAAAKTIRHMHLIFQRTRNSWSHRDQLCI
jgi:hypothetical protein